MTATPSVLTPADHRLVDIATTVRVNNGTGFELMTVQSDEPGSGLPGGDVKWDMQLWARGTPDTRGRLRAEAGPRADGRVYTFTYRTTGGSGDAATCKTTVSVPNATGLHTEIDIAPSDKRIVVRPTTDPSIRVALLSSVSLPFDPLQFNADSIRFGPRNARSLYEFVRDVNRDGLGDLVATFAMPDTGIQCGDIRASLVARTADGLRIFDSDRIQMVGCPTPAD